MKRDARDLPLSNESAEAADLLDRAVEHYLKFRADTMALVGQMLAADPAFRHRLDRRGALARLKFASHDTHFTSPP
jgi:hypothetical protein